MTNCPYPASTRSRSSHCKHDSDLQREYGPQLTCDVYWTQFWAQDGACAICHEPWPGVPGEPTGGLWRLSTDHEHAAGTDGPFRGLLCGPCNRLLTWELEREIARRDSVAPFRWTDHDGRPVVVTAELVAYVRDPPAAELGIWITKKARPPRKDHPPKKTGDTTVSPYRAHLRVVLNPRGWPPCPVGCTYEHPAPGRPRVPVVRPPVDLGPEPEPVDVVYVQPLVTRLLLVAGGTLGAVVAGAIIWALLPVIATAVVLAVTGLLALRR